MALRERLIVIDNDSKGYTTDSIYDVRKTRAGGFIQCKVPPFDQRWS